MSSFTSQNGFHENGNVCGGMEVKTDSQSDTAPPGGQTRKSAKKTLSQLHEALLKKVGCVVSTANMVADDMSCDRSTINVISSSVVSVGDGLTCSDSPITRSVDLTPVKMEGVCSSINSETSPDCTENTVRHNGGMTVCTKDITLVSIDIQNGNEGRSCDLNREIDTVESGNVKAGVLQSQKDLNDESKYVEKLTVITNEHGKLVTDNDDKIACNSKIERTKSRKALKPMKRGQEEVSVAVIDRPVEINCARLLALKCKLCSFTCSADEQLLVHEKNDHSVSNTAMQPFVCRECKYSTGLRDEFERHVAHHTGQHTVRFYQCPYCYFDTNNMMCIEAHITESHANESFRFEVMQETIFYLQRLLDCPMCHGLYQWRNNFVVHIRESHYLDSLASHLETMFDEHPFPTSLRAPRSLFNDLLSPVQDDEDCVTCQPTAVADVSDSDDEADGIDGDQNVWANDAMNVGLCDSGLSIRFHCSACDYSSEDYNAYQQHSRIHATSCSDSRQLSSSSGSLVISAGATNLLNAGSMNSKGVAKTVYQCHLCPFECLKQVHYRRHLAIHERTDHLTNGYQCGYCHFAHNRRNCVKFHLGKYHGDHPIKMSRIVDGVVVELSETDLYALRTRRRKCDAGPTMVPSSVVAPSSQDMRSFNKYASSRQANDYSLCSLNSDIGVSIGCEVEALLSKQDELEIFKQQLPHAMIYNDPVKCPKCDFTNRVRVNLIKHLKLHKEDMDSSGNITRIEDTSDNGSFGAGVYLAHSDGPPDDDLDAMFTASVSRRESLYSSLPSADEKPLLRRILSEKPLPLKTEDLKSANEADVDDVDDDDTSVLSEEREMPKSLQLSSSQQQDYSEFCVKVNNSDLYQCHRCNFTNRFPSKVKRHFYYRHAKVPPYRCGHCPFEAVERGKVARHSQLVHRSLPVVVVQQEVKIAPVAMKNTVDSLPNKRLGDSCNDVLSRIGELAVLTAIKDELIDVDCEAPLLDYYPKVEENWNAESRSRRNSSETRSLSESQCSQNEVEPPLVKPHTGSRMCRRQFRCGHCGVVSRWNRRDIILHVMHVHLHRRVYTCRHCNFGNSKSKALVRAHCIKFHPQRTIAVRDDTVLLNAIMADEGPDGVVTMAFAPNGTPLVDEQQLSKYLTEHKHAMIETVKDQLTTVTSANNKKDFSEFKTSNYCDVDITQVKRETTGDENQQLMKALKLSTRLYRDDRRPWRCRLCGFLHSRVVRVKYHVICRHLKVKPFSCPYCKLYLWKSQAVLSHVDKCHPGCKRHAIATVDEQASFLRRNVERVPSTALPQLSRAPVLSTGDGGSGDSIDTPVPLMVAGSTPSRPGLFRCKLCGYQDARNDKTKYHIVKQHLKLRQFSCPYCHVYLWGRQQVAKHVEEQHPGFEIRIQRTFHEYEQFLKNNICKVEATQPLSNLKSPPSEQLPSKKMGEENLQVQGLNRLSTLISRLPCDLCSFVTDSELSLSAHRRSHRLFQCAHCRFRHVLVAKVQSHCLSAHPSKPVHYKQWTPTAPPVLSPSIQPAVEEASVVTDSCKDSTFTKFYPCDLCPAHFSSQSGLDSHVVSSHSGVFMCQYCRLVTQDKDSMEKHQQNEHAFRVPGFEVICSQKVAETIPSNKKRVAETLPTSSVMPSKVHRGESSQTDRNESATFKCRLCHYGCCKLTVMRHHVMSHLRYHPFICPYCSLVRSVKSFPIKKHVRLKHPGQEERVLYVQNDVLEKKVKNSFYRVKSQQGGANHSLEDTEPTENNDSEDDVEVIDEDSEEQPPPLVKELPVEPTPISQTGQHKVLYRCKMCGLKTHIRMDMRHHLMREIHYKPYKCAYCPYTEPCRWSMRKHFRTRHAGIEVALTDLRDPEQDRRVEQLVEECAIPLKDSSDSLAWKLRPTSPKSTIVNRLTTFAAIRPVTIAKNKPIATSKAVSLSGTSLRLHRCTQCTYTTSNLKLLRGHLVKHGPYRLQCAYCDYRGHYPSRIYKHIRRHHRGSAFRVVKVSADTPQPPPTLPAVTTVEPQMMKLHKRARPLPGTVYLDGVALNLSLTPDKQGRFQCNECGYQTTNREHYKMHVVIHRPPKWQCFYCDQKYPLVFRLRRHSHSKHPDKPIKWVDLESGQVCVDLQRHAENCVQSATSPAPCATSTLKATARKSGARGMKVAMFRSMLFNKKIPVAATAAVQINTSIEEELGGDELLVIEDSDDNDEYSNNDDDNVQVDINSSSEDAEFTGEQGTNILRFCCHLCSYSVLALSPSALSQHLSEVHSDVSELPAVEIQPSASDDDSTGDNGSVLALNRCGLCTFESFIQQDFDSHVFKTHGLNRPFVCDFCQRFASFNRSSVEEHCATVHSGQEPRITGLDKPYTMVAINDNCDRTKDRFYNFKSSVPLRDIMSLSRRQMDSFLTSFDVTVDDELLI